MRPKVDILVLFRFGWIETLGFPWTQATYNT